VGVGGSNPLAPTNKFNSLDEFSFFGFQISPFLTKVVYSCPSI